MLWCFNLSLTDFILPLFLRLRSGNHRHVFTLSQLYVCVGYLSAFDDAAQKKRKRCHKNYIQVQERARRSSTTRIQQVCKNLSEELWVMDKLSVDLSDFLWWGSCLCWAGGRFREGVVCLNLLWLMENSRLSCQIPEVVFALMSENPKGLHRISRASSCSSCPSDGSNGCGLCQGFRSNLDWCCLVTRGGWV